ncbi:MAG TPA: NYN domain-containing protein [Hyphomicrobiaceae bacterium]|nr:NYN domain-containing protein [Hyphomicrobiaceae bacterium]
MKRETGGPSLSAVFVDYDNIYLSLKRKSEEAAKRFAKDAGIWLREIESGRLITATNNPASGDRRRIVMNRCYGNPVPRRNAHDNSTDMNSFPFVRHHFLRAGFEVIDCPPLTAQLKNSADIRMVMDVRDYLTHETYFDEFIILSGDADFTPLLHRLRAHARRTVIFANDFIAAPYIAISDGEVRESDLIALLMGGELAAGREADGSLESPMASAKIDDARREIIAEIVNSVRASVAPVPLEALADRALRALGHEKTIATGWAGAGSFRELLRQSLPKDVRLTGDPPYLVYDPKRHGDEVGALAAPEARLVPSLASPTHSTSRSTAGRTASDPAPSRGTRHIAPATPQADVDPIPAARPVRAQRDASRADDPGHIQKSIARIQEACQAPPLAPAEYRLLFEIMAKEITDNDLIGAQTLTNIVQRAQDRGLDVRRDDVRFILEVVSEADPWFEQGASANLFAGRFRNFVVARCRGQGLNLSAEELDLIDSFFAGTTPPQRHQPTRAAPATQHGASFSAPLEDAPDHIPGPSEGRVSRWFSFDDGQPHELDPHGSGTSLGQPHAENQAPSEDFPRIVRRGLRG